ncbi:MAG: hypothetical protein R2764_10905 [Bacteroidales bacterium]
MNLFNYCDYFTHSGTIYEPVTWAEGTHYIPSSFYVYYGGSLTIEPGAVIKFGPGAELNVIGEIIADGTEDNPIVFTSMDDNNNGCIIDGSDGIPEPGDWKYIETHGYQNPLAQF